MKKLLCCLLIIFVWLNVSFSQNPNSKTPQIDETFASFMKLSQQQLYDTALYYHKNNILDTALIYYNLIINAPESTDSIQMLLTAGSLSMVGVIYLNTSDFRSAYKYMTDALILAEKYNLESELQFSYNNLGMIYFHFEEYEIAKTYFLKALDFTDDTSRYFAVLSNIATIERKNGNMDTAFIYLDKALKFSKQAESYYLPIILSEMALFYKKTDQIDSALYYLRFTVNEAKKRNLIESIVISYSEIGKIYFEMNQFDSAAYYLNLSNLISTEEKQFTNIMSENYLSLSKIEELKGNIRKAFDYYKKYSSLKDSIYNTNILGDINQIQRQYEVSKTNQQIEQFLIEQQIKERTIHYQNIIWMITLLVLLLVCIGLLFIYVQKRKLSNAYKILFEKNKEIVEFSKKSSDDNIKKYKNSVFNNKMQNEYLKKILLIMEDTSIICDPKFSIEKLSVMLERNNAYISQIIHATFKKNFRSFLNEYRIKEALRLFSLPEFSVFTFETISEKVGYSSRTTFINAFKEVTGLSPSFYLKSLIDDNH